MKEGEKGLEGDGGRMEERMAGVRMARSQNKVWVGDMQKEVEGKGEGGRVRGERGYRGGSSMSNR